MSIGILTPSYNKPNYVIDGIKSILSQTFTDWVYYIVDNSTDNGITRKTITDFIQTIPDSIKSKIIYDEIDFTEKERSSFYIPSRITNIYFKKINADYLFFLADDDVIEEDCFERCMRWFSNNQDQHVCYFKMGIQIFQNNKFETVGELPLGKSFGTIFHQDEDVKKNYKLEKEKLSEQIMKSHLPEDVKIKILNYEKDHNCKEFMARRKCFKKDLDPDNKVDGGQVIIKKSCLEKIEYPYFVEDGGHATHCDGLFLSELSEIFKISPIDYDGFLGHHRITNISTWAKTWSKT